MILALIGVLSSFQQFFIAFSHRVAPASTLAPLRYLSIPVGILAGILFFGEMMTPQILIGSAVIVGSSIFILRREKAASCRRREAGVSGRAGVCSGKQAIMGLAKFGLLNLAHAVTR